MTLVPLVPIGSPLPPAADDHRAALAVLEGRLRARRAEVESRLGAQVRRARPRQGQADRPRAGGALLDPGTAAREVGTFVNHGEVFPGDQRSPAAGVVTALGLVEGAGA
jgi:acetyl-CoA carboxylase carboxyltransferase component